MILLIGGYAESGKDSTAKILRDKLFEKYKKCLIIHFADHLKSVSKLYFGWSGIKDEEGRSLLQYVGTDLIRKRDPDFWSKTVGDTIKVLEEDYDHFLVPDWRFPSEAEYLKNNFSNVITVRVNRINHQNSLTPHQRLHPSETSLDNYSFDYVMNAESGLDKLEIEVEKMISALNLQ